MAHGLAVGSYVSDPFRADVADVGQLKIVRNDHARVLVDHRGIKSVRPINQYQVLGIQAVIIGNRFDSVFVGVAFGDHSSGAVIVMDGASPTDCERILGSGEEWPGQADSE